MALRLRAAFEFGTPGVIHHSTALCTGVQQITRCGRGGEEMCFLSTKCERGKENEVLSWSWHFQ